MDRRDFLIKGLEGVIAVSLISGCDKTPEKSSIAGDYEGVYTRISNYQTENEVKEVGKVFFNFTKNTYSCRGTGKHLPPNGHGEYKVVGDKLVLKDKAFHTADFDWTLILNGEFDISSHWDLSILFNLQQRDKKTNRCHNIFLYKRQE